jgi:hypothetical protein
MTKRSREIKLKEIVTDIKEVTVVADRIVTLAAQPKSKSPAKSKGRHHRSRKAGGE